MDFTNLCDRYVEYVYPWISDHLGMITDKIPFPIGELLMYVGALWLIGMLLRLVLLPLLFAKKHYVKNTMRKLKKGLRVGGFVSLLYVFTWIIPFFSSYITFPETENKGYTYLDLQQLRDYVVDGLNEAAQSAARDEDGHLVVPAEVDADVVSAMQALSVEFPRLEGYYPRMKEAWCTDFLQWMRIGGYTFPFTMEVNGNGYDMLRLYYPTLYAHESCHHQGYYQEDEADFLSYVGLSRSEDPYVRYSAFYQMYYVVEPAFLKAAKGGFATEEEYKQYLAGLTQPCGLFYEDMQYDQEIYEKEYARRLIHPPKRLKKISEKTADVGWQVQADLLQEKIYGGSLGLMLQYYLK